MQYSDHNIPYKCEKAIGKLKDVRNANIPPNLVTCG